MPVRDVLLPPKQADEIESGIERGIDIERGSDIERDVAPDTERDIEGVTDDITPKNVEDNVTDLVPDLRDKIVAIVDVGPSHKDFVSAAIATGGGNAIADEIWAVDEMAGIIMHHRAFSMRPLEYRKSWNWIADHPGPLLSSSESDTFPGCVRYPLERALEVVGVAYLTSSSAYALAFALLGGAKTVKLYGVDAMDVRPCMEYIICKALHRGLSVQISASSTLMNSSTKAEDKLYGSARGMTQWCQ
jgi:hypothetical protein